MATFGIIGIAGYVAHKHVQALHTLGQIVVCGYDPASNVGYLDQYFPDCKTFFDFYDFNDYLLQNIPDFIVICSPNYTHPFYIHYAHQLGATVLCEKPLCITTATALRLPQDHVFVVLQLRAHPLLQSLKQSFDPLTRHDISVQYIAPRGQWYTQSWKGDSHKSGGIAMNIGIHIFDVLCWLLNCDGDMVVVVSHSDPTYLTCALRYADTSIAVHLSTDPTLPPERVLTIDGIRYDLSDGFGDLHTTYYRTLLSGGGCTIADTLPSIRLVERITMNNE